MAPIGNDDKPADKGDNCDICGSLQCVPNDHTNKPYCLCKDSTIATGDPPQCNEDSAINQEQSGFLGSNIELPGGHPGLVLSPDMFAKNPGISESKGISPHKGVDLHPQIPSHMNFTGGNAEMQVRQLIQKNGHCPTKVICKGVNCGEAGCTCNLVTKQPQCICPDTGAPPDEFLKCPYRVINPINPSHKMKSPDTSAVHGSIIGFQPNVEPKPENTSKTTQQSLHVELPTVPSQQQTLSSHHIKLLLQIAIPTFLGVIVLGIVIMVLLWRRKVQMHNRKPKNSNVVSWIQKQDQVHLLENMTVVGKNPIYLGIDVNSVQLKGIQTTYIPQGSLKLMDVIGEGAFGKVYKGSVKWTDDNTSSVAVKILKEDASSETREDFVREVKIMSSFDHPNILKLIGVVTAENRCPYMVFEYMEHGDLTDLLRCNDPFCGKGPKLEIKQNELVDIAIQIANGMVYLASKHFVHRDLATRNCLVGSELMVKISDFGMSRDIYTCDYYKIGGSRMLPVRWMSAESIKYGRFTTESDVWSYGVVLWEIFAFGKQPYYGHTNEEVIRLIDDGILLQRPQNCPDTVYHVMLGCWRKNPKDRFTFARIYRHLKDYNKTMVICYQPSPMASNSDMTTTEDV